MSGREDNILARWSRRKLSARSTEFQATDNESPLPDVAVGGAVPQTAAQDPEPSQTETAAPAEPLPRLEDLTAESDLTAFLKKGVPMALKGAALRKMWSLDPGIRDYVGPSEYAWDFNQAGSMAGFGPIDAKETIVGFLSKTARAIEPDTKPTAATQPDASSDRPTNAPPDTAPNTEAAELLPTAEPLEPGLPVGVSGTAEGISGEAEPATRLHSPDTTKPSQAPEPLSRPRHGGAMPR